MLKKVYVSKDLSAAIDESKKDFNVTKVTFCDDMTFADFANSHQGGLFNHGITCFVGVDAFEDTEVIRLGESNSIVSDVIWCFKSLAKNTKLFKSISKNFNIEECKCTVKAYDKEKTIRSLLSDAIISDAVIRELVLSLPDNIQLIKNELVSLQKVLKHTQDIALVSHSADSDIFELMTSLFNNDTYKSYCLAKKVSAGFNQFGFSALMLKKIKFYILISLDKEAEALKEWNINRYFLNSERSIARKIGFNKLIQLFEYIFNNYQLKYLNKPAFCLLSDTVLYFNKVL